MPRIKAAAVKAAPPKCACRWDRDQITKEETWHPCPEHQAMFETWEAQEPCPLCGGREGYNPKTGMLMQARKGKDLFPGHRASCHEVLQA